MEHITISQLFPTGSLRCSLTVKIAESHKCTSKHGSTFYKFLLTDGTNSVWAFSKRSQFFKELQVHHMYELQAEVKVQQKDPSTPPSTSGFEIWLNGWIACREILAKNIPHPQKINHKSRPISEGNGEISARKITHPPKNHVAKNSGPTLIQNLHPKQILSLEIYRYLGCVDCTKSIPSANSKLKFVCGRCGVEKERKWCFVTRQLNLLDLETNEEMTIVAYDHETVKLFGKKSSEFARDEDARIFAEELVGREVYLEVVQKGHELVARNIKIVEQNNNEEPTPDNNSQNETMEPKIYPVPRKIHSLRRPDTLHFSVGSIKKVLKETYDTLHPGLALIINIQNYAPPNKNRLGSGKDVKAILKLLKFLKISIFHPIVSNGNGVLEDPTREELLLMIHHYQSELIKIRAKSSMIFLMGHGSSGRIHLSSGESVNYWSDIIYNFSDGKFPQFSGNPKLFFIEACQNFTGNVPTTEIMKDHKIVNDKTADMLVVESSLPGRYSYLFPTGSIFIQKLCQCIKEWRNHLHLVDIIKGVKHEMVNTPFVQDGQIHRQMLSFRDPGLKRVYL